MADRVSLPSVLAFFISHIRSRSCSISKRKPGDFTSTEPAFLRRSFTARRRSSVLFCRDKASVRRTSSVGCLAVYLRCGRVPQLASPNLGSQSCMLNAKMEVTVLVVFGVEAVHVDLADNGFDRSRRAEIENELESRRARSLESSQFFFWHSTSQSFRRTATSLSDPRRSRNHSDALERIIRWQRFLRSP